MSNSKSEVVYCKKSLLQGNKIFVKEENFQIPPISIDQLTEALKYLEKIQNSSIKENSILELFQYSDCSLWWFLHPTLYPVIKKILSFIIKFEEFLDQTKPIAVKITDDFSTFSIISQLCKKKNIQFKYSKKELIKFKTKQKIIFQGQKYRYKKILLNKFQKRKNLFSKSQYRNSFNLQDKFVFAVPTIYRRSVLNLKTGKSEQGEYIQQTIMDFVKKRSKIIGIDLDYTFKGDFEILSERLQSGMEWIPFESFINNVKRAEHKIFLKKFKKIISNEQFKKLFEYKGISIWEQIESTLLKMSFAPYFPLYLNLIDSIADLLLEDKPKAIFLTYETGPLALPFIIAAQRYGIKTLGIAHALIPKGHAMHDLRPLREINLPLGFPIPDYTLVFGNFSKNNLINYGHPKDRIIPFGHAAFFKLDDIIKILDSSQLQKKYMINKKQKVILFTTEYLQEYHITHGKYDYDTQILLDLIENYSNKNDYVIILKPHPTENPESYEKMIEKHKAKNFKVIQDSLFELIHISDIVISVYSNSMMDALCLKKPVIRVTFDNIQHIIPYDEYGVVVSCELNELSKEIENILSNKKLREKLSNNRVKFIKDQYNIPESNPELLLDKILNDVTKNA